MLLHVSFLIEQDVEEEEEWRGGLGEGGGSLWQRAIETQTGYEENLLKSLTFGPRHEGNEMYPSHSEEQTVGSWGGGV